MSCRTRANGVRGGGRATTHYSIREIDGVPVVFRGEARLISIAGPTTPEILAFAAELDRPGLEHLFDSYLCGLCQGVVMERLAADAVEIAIPPFPPIPEEAAARPRLIKS